MKKRCLSVFLLLFAPAAVTAFWALTPASALDLDTYSVTCSQPGSSEFWERAWICPSGDGNWKRPAYQFGSSISQTCNASLAGMVQWTGTAVSPNNTLQYCDGSAWQSLGSSGPPPYPMGGVDNGGTPIQVAACDGGMTYSTASGCTGTRATYAWGPKPVTTGYTSTTTGKTNSAGLAALGSSYAAAYYCENLTAHGYSDWYLPAKDELNVLYNMRYLAGNFDTQFYWSSTESDINGAYAQRFSNGAQDHLVKTTAYRVRCVRRD